EADAVVIATGARPRRVAAEHSMALRTVEDALALRARLVPGARVVVVGAGWIGAEVATAAAAAGASVDVVEAGPTPLAGAMPAEIGRLTLPWYDAAGVHVHLGARVERVERQGAELTVALADARVLRADLVVEGVGVRPATDWLADSGIALDAHGAVVTDSRLRASRPGVWAVGDVASWWSPRFARTMRVEHWDEALHAPEVVAASIIAGGSDAGPEHDPVPYFWSEQLGHYVQYAGHHPAGTRLVHRGDPADPGGWTACWLAPGGDGERLVAVLAVDRPRDLMQGRKLIAAGAAVDVARLADPSIALREAAQPA
ncbi:MAG TPA: FAD-dependent oxidoreductase, partial [Actinomycetes bacterium]|nr:FAD-dependent oxidoreductase [Actinomycetes bacterium]